MGAWGEESCSNDGCWDLLTMGNIHEPTQEEADKCLDEVFSKKCSWARHYEKVGAVIWLLRHGMRVSDKHLKRALRELKKFNNEEHFNTWRDPECRARHVAREKEQLKEALKGDGTIKIEYVPGLFDKLAESFED